MVTNVINLSAYREKRRKERREQITLYIMMISGALILAGAYVMASRKDNNAYNESPLSEE